MSDKNEARCNLCGEPMPPGEEMFMYHGYSGNCPKPPLAKPDPSPPAEPKHNISEGDVTDTPDRLRERARAVVSEWLARDRMGNLSNPGRDFLEDRIAAFARAEREAAIEACAGIMRELRRLNLSEQTNVACEMAVEKMLALRDAGGGK